MPTCSDLIKGNKKPNRLTLNTKSSGFFVLMDFFIIFVEFFDIWYKYNRDVGESGYPASFGTKRTRKFESCHPDDYVFLAQR